MNYKIANAIVYFKRSSSVLNTKQNREFVIKSIFVFTKQWTVHEYYVNIERKQYEKK